MLEYPPQTKKRRPGWRARAMFAALDRCLKIMHRRAALLGLDIEKLALTNPTGEKEFSGGGLTDAQRVAGLRALVEEFRGATGTPGSTAGGQGDPAVGCAAGSPDAGVS